MAGPGPVTGGAARPRSLLRAVLYALLPLIVLAMLLELGLSLAGLGDPDRRLSLLRGFDESARYLLPVAARPGAFVTQMSDGRWPEVEIPPRDGRVRVLLLGGSNTKGFPEAYLQRELERAAPGRGFEVVNLGRPGYGSERVRILLDQALDALQPDIVFLYEGHNEFMERGFAAELVNQWTQPWIQRKVALLSRLRTFNVVLSALESMSSAARPAPPPEPQRRRSNAIRFLTWDQTQVYYAQFRENLRAMCRAAQAHGVGVLMSTSVENMLDPPVGVAPAPELGEDEARVQQGYVRQARLEIPERFRRGWLEPDGEEALIRLRPEDWGVTVPPEALAAQRAARGPHPDPPPLRPLLPPLDGGPWWNDTAEWKPSVDTLLATLAAVHERKLSPQETTALHAAVALLEHALDISEEPAALHTLAACTYLLGEDDALAAVLFRRAGALDRAPTHANDATNGIVREVAAEFPEVLLVDADELFRARCPGGIVGYELMMDGCHLHPDVRRHLMDDYVQPLLQLAARRGTH